MTDPRVSKLIEKVADFIEQIPDKKPKRTWAVFTAKQILFGNHLAKLTGNKLPASVTTRIPLLGEILDELGWKHVIPLDKEAE